MALTAGSIPFGPAERWRLEIEGFVTLPEVLSPSGVATLNVRLAAIIASCGTHRRTPLHVLTRAAPASAYGRAARHRPPASARRRCWCGWLDSGVALGR